MCKKKSPCLRAYKRVVFVVIAFPLGEERINQLLNHL